MRAETAAGRAAWPRDTRYVVDRLRSVSTARKRTRSCAQVRLLAEFSMRVSFGRLILLALVASTHFAHATATGPVLTRDVEYGPNRLQRLDVYAPPGAK